MHFNFNGQLFGLMTKVIESQSAYGVCAGEVNGSVNSSNCVCTASACPSAPAVESI